jgi:ribosomal protein L22
MAQDKKTTNEKKESKEKITEKIIAKEAVVNGRNVPVSKLEAVAICDFIRGKDIDKAIAMLEEVVRLKRAVPMKGEIPHRKGKIMSGRYPIKTAGEIITLLKSLKSNAIANELELEKNVLFCMANNASRAYKRFGSTRYKRTHITLKLIPKRTKEEIK